MSKIVQAINSMIQNCDEISDVTGINFPPNTGEYSGYYFKFLKYVWSIKAYSSKEVKAISWEDIKKNLEFNTQFIERQKSSRDREFALIYYPGYSDVMCLKKDLENGVIPVGIQYTTETDKTKEAYESYADLYKIIRDKLYDVDKVLDNIILLIDKSNNG